MKLIRSNTSENSSKFQVRVKMTEKQFIHNLRGSNNRSDFPPDLLKQIYKHMRENEFKIPEEYLSNVSEGTWSQLNEKYVDRGYDLYGGAVLAPKPSYLAVGNELEASLYDFSAFSVLYSPFVNAISSGAYFFWNFSTLIA
jgi:hypothetical protein